LHDSSLVYCFAPSDINDLYYDYENDLIKIGIENSWLITTC